MAQNIDCEWDYERDAEAAVIRSRAHSRFKLKPSNSRLCVLNL